MVHIYVDAQRKNQHAMKRKQAADKSNIYDIYESLGNNQYRRI